MIVTKCGLNTPTNNDPDVGCLNHGRASTPPPPHLAKMPKAAKKRTQREPPKWGSSVALTEMAEKATTSMEWCVVSAVVLSTIAGLICEVAALKVQNVGKLDHFPGPKSQPQVVYKMAHAVWSVVGNGLTLRVHKETR